VVAVTAPRRIDAGRERVALNVSYVRALERAGLLPLVVPTILDPAHAGDALPAVRGLVLTGGEDVDPARYRAAPHPRLEPPDPVRDAGELALIAAARERRMPILAICRGIQILNVSAGGTLYQDLPSERPGPVDHQGDGTRHGIRIESGSLAAQVFGGAASATVNSRHHQAVKELGAGLRATAWAEDGVIEAAERADPSAPWLMAVQWHPEDLDELALFRAFADAVR
jgi:putative glutamine amidotransferase